MRATGRAPLLDSERAPRTRGAALRWAEARLGAAASSAPEPGPWGSRARFEALYLLAGCLGLGLAETAAWPDRPLAAETWAELRRRVERRRRGEPLQYIEGRAAFRGLWLRVDPRVLIPRPETEELVERVLAWARARGAATALEIGTGAGGIAISLAVEAPFRRVVAVDISEGALNVARESAREVGCADRVDFRAGSLFEPLAPGERFDVIVSNPPYLAAGDAAELARGVLEWEPSVSLFAGPTGLEVIEPIASGAARHLEAGGLLALEIAPGQAPAVRDRLSVDPDYALVSVHRDLAGLERIVLAERART